MPGSISEKRNRVKQISRKSEIEVVCDPNRPLWDRSAGLPAGLEGHFAFEPLRERAAALARIRSIWPRGRVTQISPIHSTFTPLIALALKLVRLTVLGDLPRSTVFR